MSKSEEDVSGFGFTELPTSTVHQARLCLFEPTRRPTNQVREICTAWGRAKIKGKMGQGHADVLEAIFWSCAAWRGDLEGRIELLVDRYQLLKVANGGKQGSGEQLGLLLEDLMQVLVEVDIPKREINACGHVIDLIAKSKIEIDGPGRGLGARRDLPRHYMRVTLGPVFLALFCADLHLHYDPLRLAQLQFGVAQALARHVLCHRSAPPGGYHLDHLLAAIGAGDPTKMANRRREIRRDADGLKALGIVVEGGRVLVRKPPSRERRVGQLGLHEL
jgi:hypothetical protein